jgi:hypothetical protein
MIRGVLYGIPISAALWALLLIAALHLVTT